MTNTSAETSERKDLLAWWRTTDGRAREWGIVEIASWHECQNRVISGDNFQREKGRGRKGVEIKKSGGYEKS